MNIKDIDKYCKQKLLDHVKEMPFWQEHKDKLVIGTYNQNHRVYELYLPHENDPREAVLFAVLTTDLNSGNHKIELLENKDK